MGRYPADRHWPPSAQRRHGYARSEVASPHAAEQSSGERVARRRHRNRPSSLPAVPAHISPPWHGDGSSARHPDSLEALASSVVSTRTEDAYFGYGAVSTDHHHCVADDLLCRRSCSGPAVRRPPDASLALGDRDHLPATSRRRLLATAGSTERGVLRRSTTKAATEGTGRRHRLPARS